MKINSLISCSKLLAISFIFVTTLQVHAKIYNVSTSGSNSNSGTQNSPWKNIAFACKYSKFQFGDTIMIGVGTFVETENCKIPGGVHFIGSGSHSTIIMSSASPVISLQDIKLPSNRQHIYGFKLDGQSKTAGNKGFELKRIYGIFIHDIIVENFKGDVNGGGINISYADNCHVYDCILKNNAGVLENECGGNLGVGELNNCNFYNLLIESENAYGIKNALSSDNVIRNTKFFNIRIEVGTNNCSKWNNLAIELFKINCYNVKIFNCYLNNVLSLYPYTVDGSKTIEVYNNHFQIPNFVNAYAIEASISNLIIRNNYFDGGLYPIANWFNQSALINFTAHHNVFDNQNGPTGIVHMPLGIFPSKFYNNTIILRRPIRCFNLPNGSNIDVKNNIFMSAVGNIGDSLGLTANSTFQRNLFYGITPRGTETFTSNPLIPLTGNFPSKYVPSSGSPAINTGLVIPEITDNALSLPDLGAFEIGTLPWSVGVTDSLPPVAIAFADRLSGAVPLSINFNGAESLGDNLSYTWISNNSIQTGSTTTFTYNTAGNYNVFLVVSSNNLSDTISLNIRAYENTHSNNDIILQAENYFIMSGVTKSSTSVGSCDNLDWVCFNNVNLATGYNTFSTRAAVVNPNQKLEIRLDSPTGQLLEEFLLQQTGSYSSYAVNTFNINSGIGVQNLFFVFKGGYGVGNFDWFSFTDPKYKSDTIYLQAENSEVFNGILKYPTYVGGCDDFEWVSFQDVDLSSGYNKFSTNAAVVNTNQKIELRENSSIGNLIGEFTLNPTGSYSTFSINNFSIPYNNGIKNLYIVFRGGYGAGNFDWFKFYSPRYTSNGIFLEAESFDEMLGITQNPTYIGGCDNNEWIKFKNVDLSAVNNKFSVRAAVVNANQKIQLRLNDYTGTLLGEFTLGQTGSYSTYNVNNYNLTTQSGVEDICVVFKGGYGVGNFDWFSFSSQSSGVKEGTTDIDDVSRDIVRIYPVSNNNKDYIVDMNDVANATFKLIDLQGRQHICKTKIINDRGILLTPYKELNKGIYLLKIEGDNLVKTYKIAID